ncbi:hypothetical protein RTBOTA2_006860 [Rhodotorula toruloides]|nr:hypothetical protein RTBOTA2_006860 [Rhodotorula toruloides]
MEGERRVRRSGRERGVAGRRRGRRESDTEGAVSEREPLPPLPHDLFTHRSRSTLLNILINQLPHLVDKRGLGVFSGR